MWAQKASEIEISYMSNYKKAQIFADTEETTLKDYLQKGSKLHHELLANRLDN